MKKTVLITGANKSIGYETARQLLRLNYFVFIGSRDVAKGNEAFKQLKEEGFSDVDILQIDVADKASVDKAKAELESKIPQLDVLINNAGIPGELPQNASEIVMENLRHVTMVKRYGKHLHNFCT